MNILSLFDGMSCGQIALERVGVNVTNYYASEVDKYAIKVTQANYPDTIQLGDIRNHKDWELPEIDLIMGGSPCQGFSFAGKQLNFDDPRSKLFFEFIDILKTYKPKYFLLENVKMKKEYQAVITEHLGVEPIEINSALVSAQNRKRLYWTNIPGIEQPEDKGILLKDIIETNIKYSDSPCELRDFNQNSICHHAATTTDIKGNDCNKRVYAVTGKSPTLTTMGGGHREPKILTNEFVDRDKSYCIDANYWKGGNLKSYFEKRRRQLVFTTDKKEGHHLPDEISYRKLTPLECERLQTIPDNYSNHVSNTRRYKMIGNGWTVDVIAYILTEVSL